MAASRGFLENELRQFSREDGVTLADRVETLGVDLRKRVKRFRAREKARRKKCKVRFSLVKKNKAFQKSCQEVVTCGYDASKDLGSPCSGDVSHEEVKIKEINKMAAACWNPPGVQSIVGRRLAPTRMIITGPNVGQSRCWTPMVGSGFSAKSPRWCRPAAVRSLCSHGRSGRQCQGYALSDRRPWRVWPSRN